VAKRCSSSERLNLQFRLDFFHLFNYTNLNTSNPVVYTSATGGPSPTAEVMIINRDYGAPVQLGSNSLGSSMTRSCPGLANSSDKHE
jgi:hypothetical protein